MNMSLKVFSALCLRSSCSMTQNMDTARMLIIWTRELDTELTGIEKMVKMMLVITISIVRMRNETEPTEKLT